MYSVDINFLNDRAERPMEVQVATPGAPAGSRLPLYIGLLVGVAAFAGTVGYWFVLKNQINTLNAEESRLSGELASIQGKVQEINNVRAQTDLIKQENDALVQVFQKVRPWSSILQEIRNVIPPFVQIVDLTQTAGDTLAGGEPPAAGGIEIKGKACSFDAVNDFILVLQRSPLLEPNSVRLVSSKRPDQPLDEADGTCPGVAAGTPTFLIEYTLRSNITSKPAAELLPEFNSLGNVGLVTRIQALQDIGAIQP